MDTNTIITYLACIFFLLIIGRIFILPLKSILKLIGNSVIGGILIFIINLIGAMFNFHIGLNILTAAIVGILGIPRSNSANSFKIIYINDVPKGTDYPLGNVPNGTFTKNVEIYNNLLYNN